jgi:hypothetical protein
MKATLAAFSLVCSTSVDARRDLQRAYNDSFARVPSLNATFSTVSSSSPFDRLHQYTATDIEHETNSNATLSPVDRLHQYAAKKIAHETNLNATLSPVDRLHQYAAQHEFATSISPASFAAYGGSSGEPTSTPSKALKEISPESFAAYGGSSGEPTSTPSKAQKEISPESFAAYAYGGSSGETTSTPSKALKEISSASFAAYGGSSGELTSTPSEALKEIASSYATGSPTKNNFLCGLCPDSRFPVAQGRIYAHGRVKTTCLELDFMLTSTETSHGCLGVFDSIGFDIDIWSFCECPGVDPPKLCHLCPEANEGYTLPNKIVDGLHCNEWAHYAANALNAEYCTELIETVGTIGTCCPQGVLYDRIP